MQDQVNRLVEGSLKSPSDLARMTGTTGSLKRLVAPGTKYYLFGNNLVFCLGPQQGSIFSLHPTEEKYLCLLGSLGILDEGRGLALLED